jgi:glycosyltransferase involved in cell wall biosynthesis
MRIVVATSEVLGERMAGPAIRAWHLAAELAAEHDVELVTSAACTLPGDGRFRISHVEDAAPLLARSDVWVIHPGILVSLPAVERWDGVLVVDLYDPAHLESLESRRDAAPAQRQAYLHNASALLNRAMRRGDLFLAASGKQRDFWLGALAALGRVNPVSYDADPTLASLVALVPFGVDATPPAPGPALRGVVPGIGPGEVVLLWGGGIYNWFDPLTLIRAVDVVRAEHDEIRLVFLGAGHPNPAVPTMRVASQARDLVAELGLEGHVTFLEQWVPYAARGAYLLEADIGVSTHLDHVETAFSFRTRILDCLWAGLPVVATDGDVFAQLLTDSGAGTTVPAGDVAALAAALRHYVEDAAARGSAAAASAALGQAYSWGLVAAPLLGFCRRPRRAPDLLDAGAAAHLDRPYDLVRAPTTQPGWRGEVALARRYLADGGGRLLVRRAAARAGKLARGRTD